MTTIPTTTLKRGTIYHNAGMFGIGTIQARDITVKRVRWAQYDSALEVSYIPKGARKRRGFVLNYMPVGAIVEGWNAPKFANFTPARTTAGGALVNEGLHSFASPKWAETFEAFLGTSVWFNFTGWNAHAPNPDPFWHLVFCDENDCVVNTVRFNTEEGARRDRRSNVACVHEGDAPPVGSHFAPAENLRLKAEIAEVQARIDMVKLRTEAANAALAFYRSQTV